MFLEKFIGPIEEDQLKRFGKGLLLKAHDTTQAMMIPLIKVDESSEIDKIEKHRTFNHSRGVIYSRDLFECTDADLKDILPEDVIDFRKITGKNILFLTFDTPDPPQEIKISRRIFKIRQYKEKPRQCYNCYAYNHPSRFCLKPKHCKKCSNLINDLSHPQEEECTQQDKCMNCSGEHPSNSKDCPNYKLEILVLDKARNDKITPALARNILTKQRSKTYVEAAKNGKNLHDNTTQHPSVSIIPKTNTTEKPGTSKRTEIQQGKSTVPKPKETPMKKEPQDTKEKNKNTKHSRKTNYEAPTDLCLENPFGDLSDMELNENQPDNIPIFCLPCNMTFNTSDCLEEHQTSFHQTKEPQPDPEYRYNSICKEHRCTPTKCIKLYQCINEDTKERFYIDDNLSSYLKIKDFRNNLPHYKIKNEEEFINTVGRKRILCNGCNDKREFKTTQCLNLHEELWHKELEFRDGCRPREHLCEWGNQCLEIIERKLANGTNELIDKTGKNHDHLRATNSRIYQKVNQKPPDPNLNQSTITSEKSENNKRRMSNASPTTTTNVEESKSKLRRHSLNQVEEDGSQNRPPSNIRLNQTIEGLPIINTIADRAKKFELNSKQKTTNPGKNEKQNLQKSKTSPIKSKTHIWR